MRLSSLALAGLLSLGGAALGAQDLHFGVQGQVNLPLGDLKDFMDSKPGFGVGVHGTIDLGSGQLLRPRLDYNLFPQADLSGVKDKASNLNLGADYLYYLDGRTSEGLYFTGGASMVRWTFDQDFPGLGSASTSTTKLGLAAGLGYQWNPTFGTEVRYTYSRVNSNFSADAIQVGATIRF